jgi:hypothetical protein
MPPVFGGGEMIDRVELQSSTYAPPPSRFEAGTPGKRMGSHPVNRRMLTVYDQLSDR